MNRYPLRMDPKIITWWPGKEPVMWTSKGGTFDLFGFSHCPILRYRTDRVGD